jgi:hypothetical protein
MSSWATTVFRSRCIQVAAYGSCRRFFTQSGTVVIPAAPPPTKRAPFSSQYPTGAKRGLPLRRPFVSSTITSARLSNDIGLIPRCRSWNASSRLPSRQSGRVRSIQFLLTRSVSHRFPRPDIASPESPPIAGGAWRRRSSPAASFGCGLGTVKVCQHPGERTHLQYRRTYRFRLGWPSRGRRRRRYLTALRAFTIRPDPAIRPRLLPTWFGSAGSTPPAESSRSDAEPAN